MKGGPYSGLRRRSSPPTRKGGIKNDLRQLWTRISRVCHTMTSQAKERGLASHQGACLTRLAAPTSNAAITVASSPLNTASMSCMSAESRSACWPCSMPAECRDREEERPEGGWAMGAEKRDRGEGPEVDGTMERMCLGDSQ